MKVLESNLNLRVDRKNDKNATNLDYSLKKEIAIEQLKYEADVYCNVEYMQCKDEEYLYEFSKAGYKRITALFGKDDRGILCYVKNKFSTQVIEKFDDPHFVHIRISNDGDFYDILIFRLLVSDGGQQDYEDRLKQWNKVMNYIDNDKKMKDRSRIIMTGDWNHGYIRERYDLGEHVQAVFNYQKIKADLAKRGLTMGIDIDPERPGRKVHSCLGRLAIDHIAVGSNLCFDKTPVYSDYEIEAPIGEPDHAYLLADIVRL